MNKKVELRHVTKTFDGEAEPVIKDLDLTVNEGDFLAVAGRSGIGKTTLVRLLIKDIEPTEGQILVDGADISRIGPSGIPEYRRKIGVIFQDFMLVKRSTVYENLEIVRRIYGWNAKDTENKIMHILSFLGIDDLHKRTMETLSGGEQQKVCLARAILNDPKLLICDEPTKNLDPASARELVRLLELIHRQGTTIIMTTHDLQTIKQEVGSFSWLRLSETGVRYAE